MDKQIAEMIHAYSRAKGFLEAERMDRLARMTPEEARAIFDDLCQAWEAVADRSWPGPAGAAENRKIGTDTPRL